MVGIAAQFAEADGKLKQVRNEESEVKQKSIVFNSCKSVASLATSSASIGWSCSRKSATSIA
jgi:hypothetical protein